MPQDYISYLNEARLRILNTRAALQRLGVQIDYKVSTENYPTNTEVLNNHVADLVEATFSPTASDTDVTKEPSEFTTNEIYTALLQLSKPLADSYAQVKTDVQRVDRKSWAGPAHEIREVLRNTLLVLAPDKEVKAQDWYKQEPDTDGPTHRQRVIYIMKIRNAGSKEQDVVKQVTQLDDRIADLVRAIYSRASNAAHGYKDRTEVIRILNYFEAFAHDLLNL